MEPQISWKMYWPFLIVPAVIFYARNKFTPRLTKRVIGLTGLLGLQGAIGWWMVKSGLDEEQLAEENRSQLCPSTG